MKRSTILLAGTTLLMLPLVVHHAAAEEEVGSPSQPAAEETGGAAEATMQDLKHRRDSNPLIEPIVKPATANELAVMGTDVGVLGQGPGAKPLPLRREGEFLIERRGRLVRAPRTDQMIFQFDADQPGSPENPMVLLPCRLLENMEELISDRGDRIVFKLTGQVFVYRGSNYVLPTLFTLAIDKGNLQQ